MMTRIMRLLAAIERRDASAAGFATDRAPERLDSRSHSARTGAFGEHVAAGSVVANFQEIRVVHRGETYRRRAGARVADDARDGFAHRECERLFVRRRQGDLGKRLAIAAVSSINRARPTPPE